MSKYEPVEIAEDYPLPLINPAPAPQNDGPQDDYDEDEDHGVPV